jgi:phosphoenolpyruvate-protein phosphotransferase
MGLPAVVGLGSSILDLEDCAPVLVDGFSGIVTSFPSPDEQETFQRLRENAIHLSQYEVAKAQQRAITKDGKVIEIVANIGSVQEAANALKMGAEGVGLLRTEFLYLGLDTAPTETEQLTAYQEILNTFGARPVVVRTLDVGGDKQLAYLDLGKETNPFLGWRAIRMCLDRPEFFKVQLRALLRSSPGHDLRIMFPMISTLQEVRKAKELLSEVRRDLERQEMPIAEKIQVGIMVEIPSAVILADQFACEVDFFSIGTNDLTQYTFAAERTNERVAHLGDAIHPAILRQIKSVIEAAHGQNIWVGVCGELAGDPIAIPLLLGLGLDEFSMAPASIPHAKEVVRRISTEQAQALVMGAIKLDSADAVRQYVRSRFDELL